jgi:hypothetical protein
MTCVIRLKSGRASSDAESGTGTTIEGSLTGAAGRAAASYLGSLTEINSTWFSPCGVE